MSEQGRTAEDLLAELERLRANVEHRLESRSDARWAVDPDDARQSVARLVLALVEFVRQLLERQAIRKMDRGALSEVEIERVGLALLELERTVHELARHFDFPVEDINLDLGPLGRLL